MRRLFLAAPIAAVFLVAGCGGPVLYSVTGKVTKGGQSLAGVSIAFVPDPGNPIQTPGSGMTDDSGAYTAVGGEGGGLAPGKYMVGVTKWKGTLESSAKPSEVPTADPYQAALAGGAMSDPAPGARRKAKAASQPPAPVEARFPVEITTEKHQFDFDIDKATPPDGKPAPK